MIFHQHVAVNDSVVNMLRLGENLQELMSVLINFENGLSLIPAMGNMIDSTWILNTKWSAHVYKIAEHAMVSRLKI